MTDSPPSPPTAYGATRERAANVSYGEIEGAAFASLRAGERPSVARVREQLGRGSAATIADGLKRFWTTFGARCEGDPVALSRLPSDIAELADGLWQRALTLASQSAAHDQNAAQERLTRLAAENELRRPTWAVREREYDTAAREREQLLAETRQHLQTVMQLLDRQRIESQGKDARIAELESQLVRVRRHVTTLMAGALRRHPEPLNRSKPVTRTRQRTAGRTKVRSRVRPKRKPPQSVRRTRRTRRKS